MSYDARFVTAIDVPVEQDILYDYDDMYEVVDDKINPPDNVDSMKTTKKIAFLLLLQ